MVISTAILIVLYIIGFIMCIVANLINERKENKEDNPETELAVLWLASPLTVLIATALGIIYLIGIAMRYLTRLVYKNIYKKEEQPK